MQHALWDMTLSWRRLAHFCGAPQTPSAVRRRSALALPLAFSPTAGLTRAERPCSRCADREYALAGSRKTAPAASKAQRTRAARLPVQFIEQRFSVFQAGGIEGLGEPAVKCWRLSFALRCARLTSRACPRGSSLRALSANALKGMYAAALLTDFWGRL
jgi:hypothetical protein